MSIKPFIPRLKIPDYNVPMADFKGHHLKAFKRITALAPQIDLVLELRDARAPISSRNVLFDKPLSKIPKIILYSKKDGSKLSEKLAMKWHQNESFMFIDCRNQNNIKNLLDIIKSRYSQMVPPPPLGLRMIIIGMPNVGKSTLVNTLRNQGFKKNQMTISQTENFKKVAKTGGNPGITRSTSEIIKICQNPNILLYDTPGVGMPKVKDSKTMIVLALCGAIKANLIDPIIQADYLLFLMNLQKPNGDLYKKYYPAPTNNIYDILTSISKLKKAFIKKNKEVDYNGAAIFWVNNWRQNKEGRMLFDIELIARYNEFLKKTVDYQELSALENTRINKMDNIINNLDDSKLTNFEKKLKQQNQLFEMF